MPQPLNPFPMSKKSKQPSPVIQFLDLAWEQLNSASAHSWERLNHGMHHALALAVGGGFSFAPDDWQYIRENYRSGYWIGDVEGWYARAITGYGFKHGGEGRTDHNMSAIGSIERSLNRTPARLDGYRLHVGAVIDLFMPAHRDVVEKHLLGTEGMTRRGAVEALRTARSARAWSRPNLTRLKITSIDDSTGIWLACEYKEWRGDSPQGKPSKRHKMTADDFRAHDRWMTCTWFPLPAKEAKAKA